MSFQPTGINFLPLRRYRSAALIAIIIIMSGNVLGRQIKVACVGNSVTYGYGLKAPAHQSYPSILQSLLGDQYLVGNFGHSGATLLRKGHNPYYKTPEFQKAIQMQADLVIIHLGLNDTDPRNFALYQDAFVADYNWLIDTFRRANPGARIIICKMTPIFTGHPRFLSSTDFWYQKVQEKIEAVAKTARLPLIDLYAGFHDHPELFTDAPTLHPDRAGAARLARIIYQHLTGNFGGLRLPDIFTDNMILQREQPISVWGTANAGTTVSVHFHGITRKVKVPFNGHWQLQLPPEKASDTPQVLTIRNGSQQITLKNILMGDLWLAAGQSNMLFTVKEAQKGDSLIGHSGKSQGLLRLFNYKNLALTGNESWDTAVLAKTNQLQFFSGKWALPDKNSVAAFSAISYVFGLEITAQQNIPVGIIEIAVGGSPLISWVDRRTLQTDPLFEPALHNWQQTDYLMAWCRERAAKNIERSAAPCQRHPYEPAYNYEAGIAKFAGLPIKGVVWYQGESDADNAPLFGKLFPLFIKSWRKAWHAALPFYYIQLSSLNRPSWNYFRDEQRKLLGQIPNTHMVVTSDLGDSLNVHYTNKIPVGQRLARAALKNTYHQNIEDAGPLFAAARASAGMVTVRFTHAAGLSTKNGKPLKGFQLIDDRGHMIDASAQIKENEVLIALPPSISVKSLVYGWQPFSRANLINAAGLPASTFKADL